MTHYIISSIREGRWYVKAVTMKEPTYEDFYVEHFGYCSEAYHRAIEAFREHFSLAPEYPVEGQITGKIGDEVFGELQTQWARNTDRNIPTLSDLDKVFVPISETDYLLSTEANKKRLEESASTVEPNKKCTHVNIANTGLGYYCVSCSKEWTIEEWESGKDLDSIGVEPESKGEEILDDLFDFNNKLARFQDRIPSEIKVQWNDLLSKYAKRKASLQQPTSLPEEIKYFIKDVAENFDCDEDAHRYDTRCRSCEAKKLLDKFLNP